MEKGESYFLDRECFELGARKARSVRLLDNAELASRNSQMSFFAFRNREQSCAPQPQSKYSKYYAFEYLDTFYIERDDIFRLIEKSDLLLTDPSICNLDRVSEIQDVIFMKFYGLKQLAEVSPSLQVRLSHVSKAIDKNRKKYLSLSRTKSSKSTPVSKPMTSNSEIIELEQRLRELQLQKQSLKAKRDEAKRISQENWRQYHIALEEGAQLESGNSIDSVDSVSSNCSLASPSSYDLPDWASE